MEYNERYIPNGWTRTVEEIAQNRDRVSWPIVEEINDNLFRLAVDIGTNIDDSPEQSWEDFSLNFTYDNNEILLTQRKEYYSKDGSDKYRVVNDKNKGKEFTYKLVVYDHSTNAVMYYKVNLERVEVGKETNNEQTTNIKNPLNEKILEVIAPLDDEEDEENPFNTDFEDAPIEYKKDAK